MVPASFGNNIGLNAQTAMEVPDSKVADLTMGSKLAWVKQARRSYVGADKSRFMNWMWYICLIWCLKGVLLTIYVKLG